MAEAYPLPSLLEPLINLRFGARVQLADDTGLDQLVFGLVDAEFDRPVNAVASDAVMLEFAYDLGQAAGALAVGEAMDLAGGWLGAAGGFRAGWGLAGLAVLASLPLGRRIAAARRGASGPAADAGDVTLDT